MAKKETVSERIARDKVAFLEILLKNSGVVAAACRAANIARVTYYKWYEEDEDFAVKADDVKEQQKDYCEGMIFRRIKDGSDRMIIFYAQTQMKDRGYGHSNRYEITGADGADLMKPPEIDITKLTPEERLTLLRLGESALDGEKD